jgi:hypothetical protein
MHVKSYKGGKMDKKTLFIIVLFFLNIVHTHIVVAKINPTGGTGNGNIVIEVKSIKNLSKKIDDINSKYNPAIKNYNEYTNNQTKRSSININLQLPKERALLLMGEFAELGDVQSKSYSEYQNYYDPAMTQKKIEVFNEYLEKLLSSEKPEPELVRLLTQQIESLENQLRSSSQQDSSQALIYVTMKEKGYDNYSSNNVSIWDKFKAMVASSVMAIILYIFGFLTGWMKFRKRVISDPNG